MTMRNSTIIRLAAAGAVLSAVLAQPALAHHRAWHNPPGLVMQGRVWSPGQILPLGYGTITAWQPLGLYAPPAGYQWVRVGNYVVLVVIQTRIIVNVFIL
jgi:Ni/Co efflux regulator RcnB